MELNIVGRNRGVTDRFRAYVAEKAEKVSNLSDQAISLDVKLSRESERNGNPGPESIELTLFGRGPVIRAEAVGSDKYAAFDVALGRLLERLRRSRDRRKPHRGGRHHHPSLREHAYTGFSAVGVQAADGAVLDQVITGSVAAIEPEVAEAPKFDEITESDDLDYSPVVIRRKVFKSTPMTVDDALYYMELVGHDFYLFIDSETKRPSVVYRRKGWDYGVIGIEQVESDLVVS